MKIVSLALMTGLLTVSLGSSLTWAMPDPNSGSDTRFFAQNQTNKASRTKVRSQMMEQLNLSAKQKQDMTAIRQKYQPQTKILQEQLRKNMEELRVMMNSDASSKSVLAKHKQVQDLRNQLDDLRFQGMLESREILTPEQRKEFAQLMQERRTNVQNRKGMGQGNSPANLDKESF